MIPDFDSKTGLLPPGIHNTTWNDFVAKYGYTEHRKKLINGLYKAAKDLASCGCRLIYVDGGFIINKVRPPKDIDVCWDIIGVDLGSLKRLHPIFFDRTSGRSAQKAKYGCEFFQANKEEGNSGKPFLDFFQQHHGVPKGILRINIQYI